MQNNEIEIRRAKRSDIEKLDELLFQVHKVHSDLCVDETCRGNGVGKLLYNHVLEYAKECGCYNVTLNVWADNKNAVAFYEKIGLHVQKIGMEKIL